LYLEEAPTAQLGQAGWQWYPARFLLDVHTAAQPTTADWDIYINDALAGEAVQSVGVELPGMPGYDPNGPKYSYDPAKCEEEFKAADMDKDGIAAGEDPEGDIWTTGFRIQVAYNTGNTVRQTIAEILASNLAVVNELFQVEIIGLPWPTFLRNQREASLPMFFSGWVEDIHDPHNWFQPYIIGYGRNRSAVDGPRNQCRCGVRPGNAGYWRESSWPCTPGAGYYLSGTLNSNFLRPHPGPLAGSSAKRLLCRKL
jgi:peptide/nickel transport system substrate-binding protein